MTNLKQRVDFSGKTIYVGLDVHLKNWDVSLYFDQAHLRSFHQPAEASKLVNTLRRDYPGASFELAYESGFSGFSLYRYLIASGMKCLVVNAADIPQTDKGRKVKTDRSDSMRIGQALQAGLLSGIYIPDKVAESNRRLVRYRRQLTYDLGRSKVRIKHFLHGQNILVPSTYHHNNWSGRFLSWLKELPFENPLDKHTLEKMIDQFLGLRSQIKEITQKVHELMESNGYRETYKLLLAIPGIGPITAATFLTEIVDICRFPTFSQFNSFIGLCPGEHSSGEEERKGHMINRHHKTLRALMIEAAWVAIKNDPAFTLAYSELKKRMTGKRAIISLSRKLLHRIYRVWTKKEEYEKALIK